MTIKCMKSGNIVELPPYNDVLEMFASRYTQFIM